MDSKKEIPAYLKQCNKMRQQCNKTRLPEGYSVNVKRKEGQFIGSFAGYGYQKDPKDKNHLIIDEYAAGIVQEIFKLKLNGMSAQHIANHLNELGVLPPNEYKRASGFNYTCGFRAGLNQKWTVVSVNRILKNESYTGTLIQGKRRKILVNPLYIGKLTLKLSGAEKKMEVPPIVSEEDFQKVQERINDSVKLPAPKRRSTPNILIKKIYDRASGERLLCRTTEDETRQIYSFDRKCKCFSGKAPYIESTEVFDVIRFSLKTAQEQARYIGRLLESDKDEVKRCQNIVLNPYREQARTLMDALAEKDVERTSVYRKYERCEIEQEQLENFESRYQAEIEELEAEFKNIMMKVSVIEKAFSYVNPWLTKFQDLTTPEILERTHIKKYVERVWIEDFKRVEVVLKEEEWTRFFPEEWLRTGKEN